MGKTIDHSTVGWALKRLREPCLKLLLILLFGEVSKLAKCELYIADSTGISTPCMRRRKNVFKTLWKHEFLKLHALVGYSRQAGALVVVLARVTHDNVADCTQLGRLLEGLRDNGEPLLGDRGYDSQRNLELALEHGFKPVIKPRSVEYHGIFRKQMLREFKCNRKLYRQCGVGEAFFGGLENRYGARTRCKLPATKAASILLMAVAHNLRTLTRIRAMNEMGVLIIPLIYSTNSAYALPSCVRSLNRRSMGAGSSTPTLPAITSSTLWTTPPHSSIAERIALNSSSPSMVTLSVSVSLSISISATFTPLTPLSEPSLVANSGRVGVWGLRTSSTSLRSLAAPFFLGIKTLTFICSETLINGWQKLA